MKARQFLIAILLVLGAGAGLYALVRAHRAASESVDTEEEAAPSVVSVQVGELRHLTLHHYIEGYGTIGPAPAMGTEPAAGATLAPPTAGVVARVDVVEGQQVKQGDVVMELNSGTVTAEYAKQELERQKKLYAQQNTSLKNLQNAEEQLAALRVVAPLSGTVTRLNVSPGQAVDVNTVVAELANLKRLAVSASIPTSDASEVKVGDEVRVLTQPAVTATVSFISPAVDPSSSTVTVRAVLPPDHGLRPGQFVQLRLVTAVHTNCLAAPEESVVTDIAGHSVLSLVSGDVATRTPVQTGFREDGWVEVAGRGLEAGETVVTVGAYGLPEKTKIIIANSTSDEAGATNSASVQAQ